MKTVLRRLFLLTLLMVMLLVLLLVVETTGAQGSSFSVSAGQEYVLAAQEGQATKLVLTIVLLALGLLIPLGGIVYLVSRKRPPKG